MRPNRHDTRRGRFHANPDKCEEARRRIREEAERRNREADMAICECGGRVLHNGTEWVHVGACRVSRPSDTLEEGEE